MWCVGSGGLLLWSSLVVDLCTGLVLIMAALEASEATPEMTLRADSRFVP